MLILDWDLTKMLIDTLLNVQSDTGRQPDRHSKTPRDTCGFYLILKSVFRAVFFFFFFQKIPGCFPSYLCSHWDTNGPVLICRLWLISRPCDFCTAERSRWQKCNVVASPTAWCYYLTEEIRLVWLVCSTNDVRKKLTRMTAWTTLWLGASCFPA